MIVAWHIVMGLRDVTRIVERIHPSKIISLLAHGGLCLPFDDFLLCWCYLGRVRSKFLLEGVEEFIHFLVWHYAYHLVKKIQKKKRKEKKYTKFK